MPLSQLLRAFDEGVEGARIKFDADPARSTAAGFSEAFASFTLYDVSSAECSDPPRKPKYVRLDHKTEQPILWEGVHQPFAKILRADPDIGPCYAGFATLFTENPAVSDRQTRYYSMAIDAQLKAPGLRGALLSRKQFVRLSPDSPLALTAVCLKNHGDDDRFVPTPIVFHWKPPDRAAANSRDLIPKDLASWGHVFVRAKIPYHTRYGLDWDLKRCAFSSEISIADNGEGFNEAEFYRRLDKHISNDPDKQNSSLNPRDRLAWTVTYFAYACECYMGRGKNIDHLTIVCAPASYEDRVSAALYLPLFCTGSGKILSRAAVKTLYLARSLGLPLEKLQAISKGVSENKFVIAHQLSATIDSIVEGIGLLPEATLKTIGGHLIARLHLLRATITSYRSEPSRVNVGNFPGPWQETDCPLMAYTDIGLQLGLARAQDGPEDEQLVREYGSLLNASTYQPGEEGFLRLKNKLFDPVPQAPIDIRPWLKHTSFAVLILLVIKQAIYHTIRAQFKGSSDRVSLIVSMNKGQVFFSCSVRNPAVEASNVEREAKDLVQLKDLAERLSNDQDCRCQVDGPTYHGDCLSWITTICLSRKTTTTPT